MDTKALTAFVEYVGRPLLEDVRIILEKLEGLKLPIQRQDIEQAVKAIIALHLVVEVIKAATHFLELLVVDEVVDFWEPLLGFIVQCLRVG